jgi:uncharacterized protein YaiL (DUF2058 family)
MSNSLKDQLLGLGFKAPAKAEPPPRKPEAKSDKPHAHAGRQPDHRRDERKRDEAAPNATPRRSDQRRPDDRNAQARRADTRGPGQRRPEPRSDARPATPPHGGERRPERGRTREEIDLAKAYAIRAQREKDERIAAEQARQEEARLRREAKAKLAEFLQGKALNDPAADIARHFPYGGKIKRVHVTEAQLKALNAGELGVVQDNGRYLLVDAATLAQAEEIFAAAVALKVDPNAPAEDDPYADPRFQVPDDLVW